MGHYAQAGPLNKTRAAQSGGPQNAAAWAAGTGATEPIALAVGGRGAHQARSAHRIISLGYRSSSLATAAAKERGARGRWAGCVRVCTSLSRSIETCV